MSILPNFSPCQETSLMQPYLDFPSLEKNLGPCIRAVSVAEACCLFLGLGWTEEAIVMPGVLLLFAPETLHFTAWSEAGEGDSTD